MPAMALEEISLHLAQDELPAPVSALIEDANLRLDELFSSNRNRRVPRFLPSDPSLLFRALQFLTCKGIPPGAPAVNGAAALA